MKRINYSDFNEKTDINISPLIDMMFLLLIFFIVTASFVEEVGVDIKRPQASSSYNLERDSIMIGIKSDGTIIYGDRQVGINNIRGLVSRLLKEEKRPVILVASKNSLTGLMIEVLDECKKAGALNVSIATAKKDLN